MGQTMFKVRCWIIQSQKKYGVRVQLPKDDHVRVCSLFQKNDVHVSSMNDSVKLHSESPIRFDVQ